ncbi:2-phospho-L-lactate guanylyltransferase [Arthrobacter sp. GCM10027362]|uniref:2-phospho-L-lactate guanylyltransferase n=1 Tax=Arthrobacter sp. GCM10027362 TaxID=3273379 RepID=UPI00363DBF3A
MPIRPSPDPAPGGAWTIVVPFKGGAAAKSRLGLATKEGPGFSPGMRHEIAMAFLRDTVTAALAVPGVANIVVVSSDPALVTAVPGIVLVADPGRGLNAAAAAGISWARRQEPNRAVAVLTGDLPCLAPRDLAAALEAARHHPLSVVPDRHGTGTTMVSALPGTELIPRFGPHSYDAHLRAGHTVLPVPAGSTVRHDVDTLHDLARALQHGVGGHTRAALPPSWPRPHAGHRAGSRRSFAAAAAG